MIKKVYAENFDISSYREIHKTDENIIKSVKEIIADVISRGDEALISYAKKFDGATLKTLEVTKEEIAEAESLCGDFKEILKEAAENISAYHKKQLDGGFITAENGKVIGQRVIPVCRAGLYVPGGTASYPSTVLMNAIPAKIAGVKELIMVTPCGKDGNVPFSVLTAAKIAGVDRIFKSGGAQAIAAMAYGTESIPKCDKITGPGNAYVAAAKREIFGAAGIDMVAGPSEILIIADGSANPVYLAADMLSQAEHDANASSVLITTDEKLADLTAEELYKQLDKLPRKAIAEKSVENRGIIIIVKTLEQGAEIADKIAPEHLEIATDAPFALLPLINNAGSVFLGHNVPEAVGDYFAGPNHTLPTEGTARFSSPLGVSDFTKRSSFIYYSDGALQADGQKIAKFAENEGLSAHARSVTVRLKNK